MSERLAVAMRRPPRLISGGTLGSTSSAMAGAANNAAAKKAAREISFIFMAPFFSGYSLMAMEGT